jgi:hypothetical protein
VSGTKLGICDTKNDELHLKFNFRSFWFAVGGGGGGREKTETMRKKKQEQKKKKGKIIARCGQYKQNGRREQVSFPMSKDHTSL